MYIKEKLPAVYARSSLYTFTTITLSRLLPRS